MDVIERPDICKTEYLEFLDTLRESGVTNMFGAGSYLIDEFGMEKKEANIVLGYWMKTFGQNDR